MLEFAGGLATIAMTGTLPAGTLLMGTLLTSTLASFGRPARDLRITNLAARPRACALANLFR